MVQHDIDPVVVGLTTGPVRRGQPDTGQHEGQVPVDMCVHAQQQITHAGDLPGIRGTQGDPPCRGYLVDPASGPVVMASKYICAKAASSWLTNAGSLRKPGVSLYCRYDCVVRRYARANTAR